MSANAFRNTVPKLSFPKGNRFPKIVSPTANVVFTKPEDLSRINNVPSKKGFGFGYTCQQAWLTS